MVFVDHFSFSGASIKIMCSLLHAKNHEIFIIQGSNEVTSKIPYVFP